MPVLWVTLKGNAKETVHQDIEMNVKEYMQRVGQAARKASRLVARADTLQKNKALNALFTKFRVTFSPFPGQR